jgi:hypothetical protein
MHQKFPHLVTFAKKTSHSVDEVVQTEFLEDLFNLPLSTMAYNEFIEMEVLCETNRLLTQDGSKDTWFYIWNSELLSSKNAYKALIGWQLCAPHFSWVWNSTCQAKYKFFFWLLLLDRLNTRYLLGRKKFQLQNYNSVTLDCQHEEALIHLFWSCPFASKCWDSVCPQRAKNLSVLESIVDMKKKINKPFSMEIIILAPWSIWIVRNNKLFGDETTRWSNWKAIFNKELKMLAYRMKKKLATEFKNWVQSQYHLNPD